MQAALDKRLVLVTGAAGFIGSYACRRLLANGYIVIGVDNLNDYYDASLKHYRLEGLVLSDNFTFKVVDLSDASAINSLFEEFNFDYVVHLAAQAGVRYSITNPESYIHSNIIGFQNILECCRSAPPFTLFTHLLVRSTEIVQKNCLARATPQINR